MISDKARNMFVLVHVKYKVVFDMSLKFFGCFLGKLKHLKRTLGSAPGDWMHPKGSGLFFPSHNEQMNCPAFSDKADSLSSYKDIMKENSLHSVCCITIVG